MTLKSKQHQGKYIHTKGGKNGWFSLLFWVSCHFPWLPVRRIGLMSNLRCRGGWSRSLRFSSLRLHGLPQQSTLRRKNISVPNAVKLFIPNWRMPHSRFIWTITECSNARIAEKRAFVRFQEKRRIDGIFLRICCRATGFSFFGNREINKNLSLRYIKLCLAFSCKLWYNNKKGR